MNGAFIHRPLTNTLTARDMYQRYFWGEVIPLRGGVHLHTRGEKFGVFLHVFASSAPKAPRKIFEHFFVNFGEIS